MLCRRYDIYNLCVHIPILNEILHLCGKYLWWSSCINHILCIIITLVCVLTGGKCRRIPVQSWQSITDTQCGGETFTRLQLCSMTEPKQPSGYYHIIHETELPSAVSPQGTDESPQPIKTADWAAEADIEPAMSTCQQAEQRQSDHPSSAGDPSDHIQQT